MAERRWNHVGVEDGVARKGKNKDMKTSLEIPDGVLRPAKSAAALRGISLRQFVTEAIQDKLKASLVLADKPWMKSFGKLRHLREETGRINQLIEEEFGGIEPGQAR